MPIYDQIIKKANLKMKPANSASPFGEGFHSAEGWSRKYVADDLGGSAAF